MPPRGPPPTRRGREPGTEIYPSRGAEHADRAATRRAAVGAAPSAVCHAAAGLSWVDTCRVHVCGACSGQSSLQPRAVALAGRLDPIELANGTGADGRAREL